MADQITVVCDVDGRPAVDTIKIKFGDRTFDKDLCEKHLEEYLSNTRRPTKGRRKGQFANG